MTLKHINVKMINEETRGLLTGCLQN